MKEKIPEELRKEFEQAVLNADLDHWMVDNDRQFLDKIWDAVDKLFNQEVERRIAERMPTVDDAENAQLTYEHKQADCLDRFSYIHCYRDFMAGIDWLRSRLTNPGVNDSQKTEGGTK